MSNDFLSDYKLEGKRLPILTYPDPILAKKSTPVEVFDDALRQLAKDMLFTMYRSPGVGLAAPQIGVSKRFFVCDVDYDREKVTLADGEEEYKYWNFNPMVIINPVFRDMMGESLREEGCLSVPGIYEDVKRYSELTVEYQDLNGEKHEMHATDMMAICLQHENDHLDGIVLLDRLSVFKKNFYKKKLTKAKLKADE